MTTSDRRRWLAILGATLAACSANATTDGGSDAGPDSGPWQPMFSPRRVIYHPEVVCPAWPAPTYDPQPRPLAAPADILRVIRLSHTSAIADVERAGLPGHHGFQINRVGLTGMPRGGIQATVNFFGELAFDVDGTFLWVRAHGTGVPSDEDHWYHRPITRASRPDGTMYPRPQGDLVSCCAPGSDAMYTGPPWGGVRAGPGRVHQTMPVLFADRGIVVWMYDAGILVSSCVADGAIRWVVEWDPQPGDYSPPWVPLGHPMLGLDDGSVVADLGLVTRIGDSGEIVATRYSEPTLPYAQIAGTYVQSIHPRCGVLLHGGECSLLDHCEGEAPFYEWWSLDDLSTIAHVSAVPPVPAGQAELALDPPTQTSTCQIVYRDWIARDRFHASTARLVSIGQTPASTWTRELSGMPAGGYGGDAIAANDGGFLTIDSRAGPPFGAILTRYASDGMTLWSHQYTGDEVGARLVQNANVLMPDGALWFATTNDVTDGDWLIVAVETGSRPGWLMDQTYGGGGNWARTNAPLEVAPPPDAGVPDSSVATDAGARDSASSDGSAGP